MWPTTSANRSPRSRSSSPFCSTKVLDGGCPLIEEARGGIREGSFCLSWSLDETLAGTGGCAVARVTQALPPLRVQPACRADRRAAACSWLALWPPGDLGKRRRSVWSPSSHRHRFEGGQDSATHPLREAEHL